MLCCLSSANFPNRCKKDVKCINSRIVIIRNKKQAMLRCLRKDVADLLANGHDTKAFGRIEAVIVEMNLASCYDMIEQYCECILKQLPSLQKQRECSEEAKKAMSTLIFAAARFPDLPELSDLRHVFTERYGSQMKLSINGEFVNNMQKKSFSMDKKLQAMQGIAEELSVLWDSKLFQQKNSSRPAAPISDLPERGNENIDHLSHANNNRRNDAVKVRKETVTNAGRDLEVPSKERWKHPPKTPAQKEQVQPEPRDIHVIPSSSNGRRRDPVEKNRKKVHAAEGPENVETYFSDAKVLPSVDSIGTHNGTHKDDRFSEGTAGNSSQMTKGLDHINLEKSSVGPVVSGEAKAVDIIPFYTKSKGGKNETDIKFCLPAYDELPKAEKGLDPIAQERLHPKKSDSNNASLLNRMSHYINPSFKTPSTASDDVKLTSMTVNSSSPADNDMPNGDERPKTFSVRTKHSKPPLVENKNVVDDVKPTIQTSSSRRKEGRQASAEELRSAVGHDQQASQTRSGHRKHGSRAASFGCDEEEEVLDRLLFHYSQKGIESNKTGTRMRAPTELVLDADRAGECRRSHHNGNGRVYPRLGEPVHFQITSLPSAPTSPIPEVGAGKGPAQVTSLQPDMVSPNRPGLVHPRLPDNYDEFSARLNALRKP